MCCLCFICHQSNSQRVYELEPQRGLILSGRLLQLQELHRWQSIFHYSDFILIPSGRLTENEHAREGKRSLVTNFLSTSGLCK